jgi:hypothetical protein
MRFKEYFKESKEVVYRGISNGNANGHYWSTDKEFARQFTQSGLDKEIITKLVDTNTILVLTPLPRATDEAEVDNALKIAISKGYKGFRVDEGKGQPNSIFMI